MAKEPIKKERIITHIMDRTRHMYLLRATEIFPIVIAKTKKTSNANRNVIPHDKSIECTCTIHRVTLSPIK